MTINNLFINGQWVEGTGAPLVSTNPATGEVVWQANSASPADVEKAFHSADAAFAEWALKPLEARIAILEKYKALLDTHKEQLAKDIMHDMGKAWWESLGEVGAMIAKVDVSVKAYHERTPTRAAGETQLTHRPHGVCAVFGPYNFPGHLPNGHIVPALIAGNTIVFKPSEQTPTVGARMVQLLHEAGVPAGVVNFVPGELETAKAIVANDKIKGFFFTGSSHVGGMIHQQFAGRFDVVLALEMGGNNPLIVLDDVLTSEEKRSAAVYHSIQSAFITAGQRCTCARRLIVPVGEAGDQFIARLVEETQKLRIALPDAEEQPFYATLVNESAAAGLLAAEEKLLALGGQSLLPMRRLSEKTPLLTPAIIDVTGVANVPDEEYFGPLLKVYRVADLDEAISLANATQYGLSAGIFTENEVDWQKFYTLTHAGIVNRNRPLTGASGGAPFGGTGRSGNHNPGAYYAADYCAYPVATVTGDTLSLPETQTAGVAIR